MLYDTRTALAVSALRFGRVDGQDAVLGGAACPIPRVTRFQLLSYLGTLR